MIDKGIPTEEDHERKRTAIQGPEPQRKERRVMEDEEMDFITQAREFSYTGKSCEMILHIDGVEEFRENPEAFLVKQIKKGKITPKTKRTHTVSLKELSFRNNVMLFETVFFFGNTTKIFDKMNFVAKKISVDFFLPRKNDTHLF